MRVAVVPKLWKGATVVMGNLQAQKVERVKEMLDEVGAKIVYLQFDSLDFNPIEYLWWALKVFVRCCRPKNQETAEKLLKIANLLNSTTTGEHMELVIKDFRLRKILLEV